jgi:hypothetical protein
MKTGFVPPSWKSFVIMYVLGQMSENMFTVMYRTKYAHNHSHNMTIYVGLHEKYVLLLSNINQNWNVSTSFSTTSEQKTTTKKLCGFSPQANYTDRAIAASQRS